MRDSKDKELSPLISALAFWTSAGTGECVPFRASCQYPRAGGFSVLRHIARRAGRVLLHLSPLSRPKAKSKSLSLEQQQALFAPGRSCSFFSSSPFTVFAERLPTCFLKQQPPFFPSTSRREKPKTLPTFLKQHQLPLTIYKVHLTTNRHVDISQWRQCRCR